MSDQVEEVRRVRFYGPNDMATGLFVQRVAELVKAFDPDEPPRSTADILELHNVQQYLEHGFLPLGYTDEERDRALERIPAIRSAVARHFSAMDEVGFAVAVHGVGREYSADLIDLLGRNGVFRRIPSTTVLPALYAAGAHLGDMLASKKLVDAYDAEMFDELRNAPRGAEHLIRRYLQADVREEVHLPSSLTPAAARAVIERYIDGVDANPNYVGLIATAKNTPQVGVDAKLRLRARRRSKQMTEAFFAENSGLKTGCDVGISETQNAPVTSEVDTSDGWIARYRYSRRWLEESCDYPSILNNFQHLFGFVDQQALLVLPSYPAQLGVMERIIGTTGKHEYKVGAEFQSTDIRTMLQTRLYHFFLDSKGIELEWVIAWFFEKYLVEQFGAKGFSFTPSDRNASHLQRVRHLFVEMESAANQYNQYVQEGELDRELLEVASEQVRYREIPSLVTGKYLYPTGSDDLNAIIHLLFSDQSSLAYINEDLKSDSAARLLVENEVAYDDFEDYQRPSIDFLIEQDVVRNTGSRVCIINPERFQILAALFSTEAANFFHLSEAGRAQAGAMVAKGWTTRRSSLLTDAEADYFNYMLNSVDFSNGPRLRNRYLHGSQANRDSEDEHFATYINALRLTIALVVKINDDFCIASSHQQANPFHA
ncbi:hypothetical protein SAMN05216488_0060 [Microbacterium sp. LKL04]|uniref:hypothetical protein n=1 Tax=Microbacterium sp. LKL04 TaxID=912630 RepID=UPI000875C13C|nr:hypothetical protein [Microbacterium sp. LKL04]SCX93986.1 hypothetical protein SAMN05216488_0060 [Microbacterium sp. LKL04]